MVLLDCTSSKDFNGTKFVIFGSTEDFILFLQVQDRNWNLQNEFESGSNRG
jgi:hypothetical protein